jgi:group II intron reverse transcriptase/maturase
MEAILSRDNVIRAYRAVRRNGGGPGVDGIGTQAIGEHLRQHWETIREKLYAGSYEPALVRGVEIPKASGGKRQLGIPTVQDRLIQQAVQQVVSRVLEPTFSDSSFGYRPGRSAHDAVQRAQRYVMEGKRWVVDIDISAFFDEVNHDILMTRLGRHVRDKRVLKLVGRYLRVGVKQDGQVHTRSQGTPQGGPLSPLLANLYLDALDKELEERELSFVRYADDVAIYVNSGRSAERVLSSITQWIERHLRLRVNREKSGAGPTGQRKLLGFLIDPEGRVEVAPESKQRYRAQVRTVWDVRSGLSGPDTVKTWQVYLRGWWNYFGIAQSRLSDLSAWTRRHMRKWFWQRWHNRKGRLKRLRELGLAPHQLSRVHCHLGAWPAARQPGMHQALSNRRLRSWGLLTPDDLATVG